MSSQHSEVLTGYLQKRTQLITEDRALRLDYARATTFTPTELQADRVVRAIRAKEAETIWGVEYNDVPHPFPGMEFLTGKNIILKTRLFDVLSKMPKGALLHVHQHATVEAEFLLKLALEQPAIHIRCPKVIDASTISGTLPEIMPVPEEQYTDSCGITDATYLPNTWVQIRKARKTFDPALGGPEGFDRWIINTFVLNPSEAYGTHNTSTKIWLKFQSTFVVTDPIIRYMPNQEAYLRRFITSSIADGISYIESRYNFIIDYLIAEDGKTRLPIRELFLLLHRLIKDIQAEMKQQGREDEFAGVKIIYNVSRTITCEQLDVELKRCIEFKREFPHLIAGFDLVGHEDMNKPLIDYAEPFLRFIEYQKQEGIEIPFLFHAGETLGDGTMADMNLYDAILLGTKRIGHGFSLAKHPKLMEMCRKKQIALEVCPISNEILRLTSSMAMHPLPIIMNQGIPVTLASDDPAMFNSMGLSFDFYQVLVVSEVTGLLTLGQMARDSITYSMLEEEDKQKAMAVWERRWKTFIEEVAVMEL
ncbi:Metallo-dependent hydrolase [Gyrodon lividus]|nr:Metallo-dependent hydrolase [Gyrodon lividus]